MTSKLSSQDRLWRTIHWVLRITVVLQCLGNWRWLAQLEETPLLHWMLNPADIGGLAWSESTALATQQVIGWSVLLAAAWVLWRPNVYMLGALALLQLMIAVAMWQLAEGFALQAEWAPPQLLLMFPFATRMARIVAPLGLMLLVSRHTLTPDDHPAVNKIMQIMRWSIAIVFLAHGIEAWQLNPKFIDLIINSTTRLFGSGLSEANACYCLKVIGAVDVVVAVACVSFRWLAVLWWITLWGGLTALSRLFANGWEMSWHEVLTRTPHLGLPLAVVLWWHLLEYKVTETSKQN